MSEHEPIYPEATRELAGQRNHLAPSAYAHSVLALDTIAHIQAEQASGWAE